VAIKFGKPVSGEHISADGILANQWPGSCSPKSPRTTDRDDARERGRKLLGLIRPPGTSSKSILSVTSMWQCAHHHGYLRRRRPQWIDAVPESSGTWSSPPRCIVQSNPSAVGAALDGRVQPPEPPVCSWRFRAAPGDPTRHQAVEPFAIHPRSRRGSSTLGTAGARHVAEPGCRTTRRSPSARMANSAPRRNARRKTDTPKQNIFSLRIPRSTSSSNL